MPHAQSSRGSTFPVNRFAVPGRFGRLFTNLHGLERHDGIPLDLGARHGPMEERPWGAGAEDNPRIAAGYTYFGQFLTHDITFDPTSSLERRNDPTAVLNFRTPAFELDSLYGTGPDDARYLYRRGDHRRFYLLDEERCPVVDVPRNAEGLAIIADPRNDENLILSQLHLAFLKLHNHLVDLHSRSRDPFARAQQGLRWHYQWLILNEYMPLVCGEDVVERIQVDGPKYFRWDREPFIPVEFSVAAFRFGHSQVRSGYRVSTGKALPLLKPGAEEQPPGSERIDLRGHQPVTPEWRIDWRLFFDGGDVRPQPSRKINTRLAAALFQMPREFAGEEGSRDLAARDIERGIRLQVPSGQDVAYLLGITPLDSELLWHGTSGYGHAPLWWYILREAEVLKGGEMLGPVGATIVSEVLHGLLQGDKDSYLNRAPRWTPFLKASGADRFTLASLLSLADRL